MIKISEILFKKKGVGGALQFLLALVAFFLLVVACSNDNLVEPRDPNRASLSVVVRNSVTGALINDATVTLLADGTEDEIASRVSSRGTATFSNVQRGSHSIMVEAAGYLGVIREDALVSWGADAQLQDQTVQVNLIPLTASLTGHLTFRDPANPSVERPAAGAKISVELTGFSTQNAVQRVFTTEVKANGKYEFKNLPATQDANYRIVLAEPFRVPTPAQRDVEAEDEPVFLRLTNGFILGIADLSANETVVVAKQTLTEIAELFRAVSNVISIDKLDNLGIAFNAQICPNNSVSPSALLTAIRANNEQRIERVEYDGIYLLIRARDGEWTAPRFEITIPAGMLKNAAGQAFAGATFTVNVTDLDPFMIIGERTRRLDANAVQDPENPISNQRITLHFSEDIAFEGENNPRRIVGKNAPKVEATQPINVEFHETNRRIMYVTPVEKWREGDNTITVTDFVSTNNNALASTVITVEVSNLADISGRNITLRRRGTDPISPTTQNIVLEWSGIKDADGYEIFIRDVGEDGFVFFDKVEKINAATPADTFAPVSFNALGRDSAVFMVQAFNERSRSRLSNQFVVKATTGGNVSEETMPTPTAGAVNCDDIEVVLNWAPVKGALIYQVQRRVYNSENGENDNWTTINANAQPGQFFDIDEVAAIGNRRFEFRVRALGTGTSATAWSNLVNVSVVAPAAPQIVAITDQWGFPVSCWINTFRISFPLEDGSDNPSNYEVQFRRNSDQWTDASSVSLPVPSYSMGNQLFNVFIGGSIMKDELRFRIRRIADATNYSCVDANWFESNIVKVAGTQLADVQNIVVEAGGGGDITCATTHIDISWNDVVGVGEYYVEIYDVSDWTLLYDNYVSTNYLLNVFLDGATEISINIYAISPNGGCFNSSGDIWVSVPAPEQFDFNESSHEVKLTSENIVLTWADIDNVDEYQIEYSLNFGGWQLFDTVLNDGTETIDLGTPQSLGAIVGSTVRVRIRGVNCVDLSAEQGWSTVITITVAED